MENLDTGNSPFNMSIATLERIDNLLQKLSNYTAMAYVQGNPVNQYCLRIQKEIYKELHPHLSAPMIKIGDDFMKIFKKHPIKNKGKSLFVPNITEEKMEAFDFWLRDTFQKELGLLLLKGDDPARALMRG